jgi:glycosyltransferase involved in cell wall biosynthesis
MLLQREPNAPKRVIHAIVPGRAGGKESVVLSLASGLLDRGWEVTLMITCLKGRESSDFVAQAEAALIPHHVVLVKSRRYDKEVRALRDEILRQNTPLLHTHGYRSDFAGALTTFCDRSVRLISTAHGFTAGDLRNRMYEWLQLKAMSRAKAVVAVAGPVASVLEKNGVPTRKIHVVRNAWRPPGIMLSREEARAHLGLSLTQRYIGWIGRLSLEKGADVAIEAMSSVPLHSTLVIVGSGREQEALEQLVKKLGMRDRVHFVGLVNDAWKYVKAFDFLLLSSRTEGTPMTLFEAIYGDVPIIASNVGGVPELLSHDSAWLVKPDNGCALGKSIGEALSDPCHGRGKAQRARKNLFDRFGYSEWIDSHEALYERVLA